ncbi:aromatic acid exporter family protein [uncultured Fusobacterium sp.]|uniref:aromatic acid exporter family protein n=1 Tax=uncultured Fusobacterium sp. TaxID=159267 RepID=UPI0025E10F47|nr:aromatic acid exporter family protein [uncultured Fusobacterium sp.]
MKYIDHKVIKTALGTFISIYLAELLGIKFGATAGIVTIISIQATKKESIKIAFERFLASLIGLFIAVIAFKIFGYSPFVFGIFILIFMPVCLKLKLFQGFLCTVVLATHILSLQKISVNIIRNEIYILLLGIVVALILNMYMPNMGKELEQKRKSVDILMKTLLNYFGDVLITGSVFVDEETLFKELKKELDDMKEIVYKEYNNDLFDSSRKDIDFVQMKRNQYKILIKMRNHFYRFYLSSEHALIISEFIRKVSDAIGVDKLYQEVLLELEKVREIFKNMPLPKSRVEFESRAVLFQFLNDTEDFLELKKEYMKKWR